MSKTQSRVPKFKTPKGRTNITLRNPCILTAHQAAVKLGLIRQHSTSEWIEEVMKRCVRDLSPKLKRELFKLAPELHDEIREGIAIANTK